MAWCCRAGRVLMLPHPLLPLLLLLGVSQCVNCSDGLTTQAAAQTTPTSCLAPPGYGYYKDAVGDNNPVTSADLEAAQSKVFKCPGGSYKVCAWDRIARLGSVGDFDARGHSMLAAP
jgi:hypothetical protein